MKLKSIGFAVPIAAVVALAPVPTACGEDPPKAAPAEEKFVTVEGNGLRQPGRVRWTPEVTLLFALAAAGGTDDFSRSATLIRGEEKTTYRLKKLRRFPETDPKLQPGDRIQLD